MSTDDADDPHYKLSALQRQIPELRKRTWPDEDAPEIAVLNAKREAIRRELDSLQSPPSEAPQAPVSDPGGGAAKPSAKVPGPQRRQRRKRGTASKLISETIAQLADD